MSCSTPAQSALQALQHDCLLLGQGRLLLLLLCLVLQDGSLLLLLLLLPTLHQQVGCRGCVWCGQGPSIGQGSCSSHLLPGLLLLLVLWHLLLVLGHLLLLVVQLLLLGLHARRQHLRIALQQPPCPLLQLSEQLFKESRLASGGGWGPQGLHAS